MKSKKLLCWVISCLCVGTMSLGAACGGESQPQSSSSSQQAQSSSSQSASDDGASNNEGNSDNQENSSSIADENSSSDEINSSTPDNDISSDEINSSTPDNDISSDETNSSTPDNDSSSDEINSSTPDNDISSDETNSSEESSSSEDDQGGTVSEGLEYMLRNGDTEYSVTGIGSCTDTKIVIPSTYNGLPVTAIGDDAFGDCESLTSIEIPNSVTSIGEYAFCDCYSLTNVTMGNGITSIGMGAFWDCYALTSMTIPDSVTFIGVAPFLYCDSLTSINVGENNTRYQSIDGNLYSKDGKTLVQYASGKTARDFTVPNGVTTIDMGAVGANIYLTSVKISDSVNTIGFNAFIGCVNLTSITLGRGVTSIENRAFYDCYSLAEIINKSNLSISVGSEDNGFVGLYAKIIHNGESKIVNKDDYLFITADGVHYLLGYVGADKDLVLPENYNEEKYVVNAYAFEENHSITSVAIGNGVVSIAKYAFHACTSLKNVTIGNGVITIDENTFGECHNLESVIFDTPNGWYVSANSGATSGENVTLSDSSANATYLTTTYREYYWKRN